MNQALVKDGRGLIVFAGAPSLDGWVPESHPGRRKGCERLHGVDGQPRISYFIEFLTVRQEGSREVQRNLDHHSVGMASPLPYERKRGRPTSSMLY